MGVATGELLKYFIKNTVTGDIFYFQGMPNIDTGYTVGKTANFVSPQIVGRSSPIFAYRDSNAATFNVQIPIVVSVNQHDGGTYPEVKKWANWFRSLTYPDYSHGTIEPPPPVILGFGQQFTKKVIVTSTSITFRGPWDSETGISMLVLVSLSCSELADSPWSTGDIAVGADNG